MTGIHISHRFTRTRSLAWVRDNGPWPNGGVPGSDPGIAFVLPYFVAVERHAAVIEPGIDYADLCGFMLAAMRKSTEPMSARIWNASGIDWNGIMMLEPGYFGRRQRAVRVDFDRLLPKEYLRWKDAEAAGCAVLASIAATEAGTPAPSKYGWPAYFKTQMR